MTHLFMAYVRVRDYKQQQKVRPASASPIMPICCDLSPSLSPLSSLLSPLSSLLSPLSLSPSLPLPLSSLLLPLPLLSLSLSHSLSPLPLPLPLPLTPSLVFVTVFLCIVGPWTAQGDSKQSLLLLGSHEYSDARLSGPDHGADHVPPSGRENGAEIHQ